MPKTETLENGCQVTIYPAKAETKIMLYFHGGGLVYGSRSDIPQQLVSLFNRNNYTVIALDYLLAPNSTLPEIMTGVTESFQEIVFRWLKDRPFAFCGRSAGSYLMLLLTRWLQQTAPATPERLIAFYGYYDLAFINDPRNLSPLDISQEQVNSFDTTQPLWDNPTLQRYLLYLYGAQQLQLSAYYGITPENRSEFQLTDDELKTLPPIFASASNSDNEVPFKYSKRLGRLSPANKFVPVYYLSHDFLKELQRPEVQHVLIELEKWL